MVSTAVVMAAGALTADKSRRCNGNKREEKDRDLHEFVLSNQAGAGEFKVQESINGEACLAMPDPVRSVTIPC